MAPQQRFTWQRQAKRCRASKAYRWRSGWNSIAWRACACAHTLACRTRTRTPRQITPTSRINNGAHQQRAAMASSTKRCAVEAAAGCAAPAYSCTVQAWRGAGGSASALAWKISGTARKSEGGAASQMWQARRRSPSRVAPLPASIMAPRRVAWHYQTRGSGMASASSAAQ